MSDSNDRHIKNGLTNGRCTYKPNRISDSEKPDPPDRKHGETPKRNLDELWTTAFYGDVKNFPDDKNDKKEGWRILSTNEGGLILKNGVDGKAYEVNIANQYEVSIGDDEGKVCKGALLSELMRDVVEKTGIKAASHKEGATLISKHDLVYFVEDFRLKGDEIITEAGEEGSKILGKGEFGEVVIGEFRNSKSPNKKRKVAIKRVKQTSEFALTGGMELAVMATLSRCEKNDHLLRLFGWYMDSGHLNIVFEYMPNGCLHERLKRVFLNNDEKKHKEQLHLVRYVSQIASGMKVMEEHELLHRDLATRNILLDENDNIKIGDFGLSRPFESRYSSGLIATRWMAPEVLVNENTFTNKADIWSFGVVVWEIYSFGGLPYSDVASSKLGAHLRNGKRLEAPVGIPPRMATLMGKCWKLEPKDRPSFNEIDNYLRGKTTKQIQISRPPPTPPKYRQPISRSMLNISIENESNLHVEEVHAHRRPRSKSAGTAENQVQITLDCGGTNTATHKDAPRAEAYDQPLAIPWKDANTSISDPTQRYTNSHTIIASAEPNLTTIWTPVYYGDYEDLRGWWNNSRARFVVYSSRKGDLTLNDTQTNCRYQITNHYQVAIDDRTYRGHPLCSLIKSIYEDYGGFDFASFTNAPSLIYLDDLKHFAADKMLQPLALLPKRTGTIEKGDFGRVIRSVHPQTIGNFGLSRPIGTRYNAGSPNPKWSAPEVLQDENNSDRKSDVWSFGVLIWEIYTLGSEPYEEVARKDVLQFLLSGRRLDTPKEMPKRIAQQIVVKRVKQNSDRALTGAMELFILCEFQKYLANDHITPFLGWYLEDRSLCIVTDGTQHEALLDYLVEIESPDYHQEEFERIIRPISSGMSALELKQIEHRDLAARNIFLGKSNSVRVSNNISTELI
nr:tyrosine protein kinase csk [Hymenolepis microstoma]